MRLKPTVTAWVATLALVTGTTSAVGGVLVNRAADRKVCDAKVAVNKSVRDLFDDFIAQQVPPLTKAQKTKADDTVRNRFPNHC